MFEISFALFYDCYMSVCDHCVVHQKNEDGSRSGVSRESFLAAAACYEAMYRTEDGIPATFQVFFVDVNSSFECVCKMVFPATFHLSFVDMYGSFAYAKIGVFCHFPVYFSEVYYFFGISVSWCFLLISRSSY